MGGPPHTLHSAPFLHLMDIRKPTSHSPPYIGCTTRALLPQWLLLSSLQICPPTNGGNRIPPILPNPAPHGPSMDREGRCMHTGNCLVPPYSALSGEPPFSLPSTKRPAPSGARRAAEVRFCAGV